MRGAFELVITLFNLKRLRSASRHPGYAVATRLLSPLMLAIALLGCGPLPLASRPEFDPPRWTAAASDRAWSPASGDRAEVEAGAVALATGRAPQRK